MTMFNPRSPAFKADPIGVYNELRRIGPVFPDGGGRWVATSYQACSQVLGDASRIVKAPERSLQLFPPGAFHDYNKNTMAFMDPPQHPRVRAVAMPPFGASAIRKMTASIERICDELLDPLVTREAFDFAEAFAGPYPLFVICEMLGVPRDHREMFREGAHNIVTALEPQASEAQLADADCACRELSRILLGYVGDLPRSEEGNLIDYLKAKLDADQLTQDEFVFQLIFILVAGHETTASLLTTAMKILIEQPETAAAIRADPGLTNNAVAELLRLNPPLQFTSRTTAEAMVVDGVDVPAGVVIVVLIGSANRDPKMFPDPDRLDLERSNAARHLAFAAGPHTCLGNNLARMEIRIAIDKILARLPPFELAGRPEKNLNILFQGLSTLPLRRAPGQTRRPIEA